MLLGFFFFFFCELGFFPLPILIWLLLFQGTLCLVLGLFFLRIWCLHSSYRINLMCVGTMHITQYPWGLVLQLLACIHTPPATSSLLFLPTD